jgi:phosphoenolpyruvate carboxylase
VIGIAVGAYFLVRRRRAHAAAVAAWRRDLGATAEKARSVKEMLDDASAAPIAAETLDALRNQVDTTATQLAALATRAPDEQARARTSRAEQALRGYMAAVGNEQLPDAAATRAASAQELDGALTGLNELTPPSS